jgi:ubiquinone/menaquinone biosynthesis C-methylase UbiE
MTVFNASKRIISMTNGKLGLPFEYQKNPEFFDAYNLSEDTDTKNSIIEGFLRKYKVNTVLDLTCGTGSQVFYLMKHGYDVVGSDFSPALLEIARKKAAQQKMKVKFIDGDMRSIQVGQFDAAITIFNAVGHLTKDGFEKAMKNIHRNLHHGGLYVFDILNLEAMTDEVVTNLAYHIQKKVGNIHIHGIQCSTIDRKKGRLTAFDHVVLQKNAEKPQWQRNRFTLQIYTAKELQEMLIRHGFEILGQYELDGSAFTKKKSLSILTVARKL